jgi:hypothetical protein
MTCLRERNSNRAEELLEIAMTMIQLLHNSASLRQRIVFPAYEAFIKDLERHRHDLFNFSRADIESARAVNGGYIQLQDRWDGRRRFLDRQIDWLLACWPDDAWGKQKWKNLSGLRREREDIERLLTQDAEADIVGELTRLEELLNEFTAIGTFVRHFFRRIPPAGAFC